MNQTVSDPFTDFFQRKILQVSRDRLGKGLGAARAGSRLRNPSLALRGGFREFRANWAKLGRCTLSGEVSFVTTMVIRPAAISDLESLCDLFCAFFDEDGITSSPDAIARNLRRMLLDDRACFFVAVADGCVAGFSSGSITFGVEFGCAAELEDLYIRPQYRGLGWARPLASAVLDWAENRGATETFLVITPQAEENQSLTKFYEKLGFKDSRRITMYRENTKARE